MKRTPLKRTAQLRRATPVKARNTTRRAREFVRAYGGVSRVLWVQRQPSVVSGKGPCENCHVAADGAGRKADARWIVPLTFDEHRLLHAIGKASFEALTGVDLDAAAVATECAWQAYFTSTTDGAA